MPRVKRGVAANKRKKRILRQAVADLVPESVLTRPKRGFGLPMDRWMREELAANLGTGIYETPQQELTVLAIGVSQFGAHAFALPKELVARATVFLKQNPARFDFTWASIQIIVEAPHLS